jgi:dTDP-4-amino-4,6-dideoxygalactose transaminase
MSSPDITEAEVHKVSEVVRSGRLSLGPQLETFEESFSKLFEKRFAVGVSSGTAGLHLALLASGVKSGDAVITSPFSFVASVNAVLYLDAVPIFADVDPSTGNIDPDEVEAGLAAWRAKKPSEHPGVAAVLRGQHPPVPRALLPVHVFGRVADMGRLCQIAGREELTVIEDACEALGSRGPEGLAGTSGVAAVFAFYPNKQMTTGEGGMIVTDDSSLAERCRSLRNQGRDQFDMWLEHTRMGFNYRMDEMSAALGVVQLSRLAELLEKRRVVAERYSEALRNVEWLEVFGEKDDLTVDTSWFVFVIRLAQEVSRDELIEHLESRGVPSRPYFSPLHLQPYMVDRFGFRPGSFPVTEELGRRCLALPFSGIMSEQEVDQVVEAVQSFPV